MRIIISLFNQAQLLSLRLIQARFHTESEKEQLTHPSMNKTNGCCNQVGQDKVCNSSQSTFPNCPTAPRNMALFFPQVAESMKNL